MQQEKDKVYELVKADYENGMTYKELEETHGISANTIKSWRARHHWERQKKKTGTKAKKKRTAGKAEDEQEPIDTNLTNRQEMFCTYFIRCFNATRAYMMAYDVSYPVAAAAGSRLLKNKYIKQRIRELKKNRLNQSLLKPEDIVQKYIDIACSDMSNFAEVKGNSIIFKNTNGDMAGVKKITTGKTRSIEMQDQMKALQWLADHMDMATEEQRLRIAKMQVDINRATGKKDDDELTKVDELLGQIKQQAGEVDDTES